MIVPQLKEFPSVIYRFFYGFIFYRILVSLVMNIVVLLWFLYANIIYYLSGESGVSGEDPGEGGKLSHIYTFFFGFWFLIKKRKKKKKKKKINVFIVIESRQSP